MELWGKKPTVFIAIPKGRLEFTVTLEHDGEGFFLVASGTYESGPVPPLDEEWCWFYGMLDAWTRWFDLVGRRILEELNRDAGAARFDAVYRLLPRPAKR